MKNEIIIFENQGVKLEVNMKDETVWLNQTQMANLFEKDRTVITKHINNILNSGELVKEEVSANFAHTTKHGSMPNKTQTKEVIYYNLDMIISLLKYNSQSDIFALERNKGLSSVINNIYASFGGEDVYKTIEEKASNFLYLIIKNHVFIDGNKSN